MISREQLEHNVIGFWVSYLKEVEVYLNEMKATQEERYEVYDWVNEGNDFMSNGVYLYGEDGLLLDYISAKRFIDELQVSEYAT